MVFSSTSFGLRSGVTATQSFSAREVSLATRRTTSASSGRSAMG